MLSRSYNKNEENKRKEHRIISIGTPTTADDRKFKTGVVFVKLKQKCTATNWKKVKERKNISKKLISSM